MQVVVRLNNLEKFRFEMDTDDLRTVVTDKKYLGIPGYEYYYGFDLNRGCDVCIKTSQIASIKKLDKDS